MEVEINLICHNCNEVTVRVDKEDDSKSVKCPECNEDLSCGLSVKDNT